MTVLAEKYKRLVLDLPLSVNGDTDLVVETLNDSFHSDDFHVTRNGSEIEVWLRQIDISEMYTVADDIARRYGGNNVLHSVIQAVESVRSYGINSGKRLYVGYNAERKVAGRKEKELRRGKHFYANDNDFSRTNNEFPGDLANQVVCDDSEQVLASLPDNCVDLVVTSPPYNFGQDYAGDSDKEDAADWEAYFDKLFAVFDQCIRVLKFGGRIVVNVQPLFSDYIPSHHIISSYFMDRRLIWKGEILWEKNNYNCKYTAWGSWKSPSSPYLKYTWEFLEVFCKGDLKKRGKSADADISADQFKEWVMAKWSIAPERKMKQYGHPAMFPEELVKRVMLLFSFRGDVVVDPFNGAGTTTAVARQNGRQYLGIDTAPEYCAAATSRLEATQIRGLN